MRVYEFWLRDVFRDELIETLAVTFLRLHDDIFSLSRNPRTHWVQLLARDSLPSAMDIALRGRISGLSDATPLRFYISPGESIAPMESPKDDE